MTRPALAVFLVTVVSTGVQAEPDPYGLLFTTPEQRARLDNRFNGAAVGDTESQADAAGVEPRAAPPLKINGTLVSSGGKKQVWINGESRIGPVQDSGGLVQLLNAIRVRVRPTTHELKPGQVLDPNTGSVSEVYQLAPAPEPLADSISETEQPEPES